MAKEISFGLYRMHITVHKVGFKPFTARGIVRRMGTIPLEKVKENAIQVFKEKMLTDSANCTVKITLFQKLKTDFFI